MKKTALKVGGRTKKLIAMMIQQFQDPYYQGVAAQIAFSLFLSIIPILILLSQMLGMFSLSLDQLQAIFGDYVTEEGMALIDGLVDYSPSGINSIFLGLVALWAASRVHFSLLRITNYTLTDGEIIGRGFLRDRLHAIRHIVMTIFTVCFSLIVIVYGELIMKLTFGTVVGEEISTAAWVLIRWPITIGLYFLMISYNYYMLPSKKVPFVDIIPGSVFAAIGFWIVTYGFTLYTGLSTGSDIIYGSISNIVALMFWFWLLAWVMCLGVSFNRVWWATRKNNTIPIPQEVVERRKPLNIF
ncbi:MAG: YihY/virulence factor BrkB family protein [Firmicutes bacterium]|nr:YihY/virulence factor BrkB family protein [Bacillota bacterium]